jgi:hypothetical protein
MWVLVAAVGSVIWLSVLGFFLALCRASSLADEQARTRVRRRPVANERSGAQIFDIRVRRTARADRLIRAR